MGSVAEHEAELDSGAVASHRLATERVLAEMRRTDGALSLHDMADVANFSPYHFARVFRAVTAVSPGEFMTALRLERAKRLLLTTDLSVTEVCFEVGYNSLGTFTTRFNELVGLPPGRLRRLPEELDLTPERTLDPPSFPDTPPGTGVAFRISGLDVGASFVYVGLFPGAIPQRRPVACAILTAPGVHRIAGVPDGTYHLMAAALPGSGDALELLLPGDDLRVGRGERLVSVREGRVEGIVGITMRHLRATDPPLLIAFSGGRLFEEQLTTTRKSKIREVPAAGAEYA